MKIIIIVLSLIALACGSLATLPSATATTRPIAYTEPTLDWYIPVQNLDHDEIIETLGKLNVRSCPSTQCSVIRVMAEGESAYVGTVIVNDDWNCHKWLPLMSEAGFICQEWTAYK